MCYKTTQTVKSKSEATYPLSASVALIYHIETSQLICTVNQLTDFYVRATLALNGFKNIYPNN